MVTPISADPSVVKTATEHLLSIPAPDDQNYGIRVPIERLQTFRNAASALKARGMKFKTKVIRSEGAFTVMRVK